MYVCVLCYYMYVCMKSDISMQAFCVLTSLCLFQVYEFFAGKLTKWGKNMIIALYQNMTVRDDIKTQ